MLIEQQNVIISDNPRLPGFIGKSPSTECISAWVPSGLANGPPEIGETAIEQVERFIIDSAGLR
jgi:hypothetical protein